MRRTYLLLLGSQLLAGLTFLGCGYSWGFTRPEGIRTIAVEVYENETFRRGIELSLTESISNEILSRSGLRIEKAEKADAILRGRIKSVSDQLLLQGPNLEARESAVWIETESYLIDRKTGKTISSLKVTDRAEFLKDNLETRETATKKAVQRVAEKIVLGTLLTPNSTVSPLKSPQ